MTAWRHGPKPTLGLIGAIGAGKSTVAGRLAARGGAVIDCDAIGHAALEDPDIRGRILDRWGAGGTLLRPDGRIDRRALGAVVFGNPDERRVLESLVFPYIGDRALAEVLNAQTDPAVRFAVVDAAVMLEAGWDTVCDRILYVDAPRALRLARLATRCGWTDAELARREAAQWPAERKMRRADVILVNDGTIEHVDAQLDRVLAEVGVDPDLAGAERRA